MFKCGSFFQTCAEISGNNGNILILFQLYQFQVGRRVIFRYFGHIKTLYKGHNYNWQIRSSVIRQFLFRPPLLKLIKIPWIMSCMKHMDKHVISMLYSFYSQMQLRRKAIRYLIFMVLWYIVSWKPLGWNRENIRTCCLSLKISFSISERERDAASYECMCVPKKRTSVY